MFYIYIGQSGKLELFLKFFNFPLTFTKTTAGNDGNRPAKHIENTHGNKVFSCP